MKAMKAWISVALILCLAGSAAAGWITSGSNMYSDVTGNVGIGTNNPQQKLHVVGFGQFDLPSGKINVTTPGGWPGFIIYVPNGHRRDVQFADWGIAITANTSSAATPATSGICIREGGDVGIGTGTPAAKLEVRGKLRVSNAAGQAVVELGEGLDYAEGFDVSDGRKPEPGTVLVIDANHPGELTVSGKPYDRSVVGIVAGGKGLSSAVRLGVGQFDCDVALAGRVYCNVDATDHAVMPGDLLTTAARPGYAMAATDHTRAQGAILGKAMEKLEKGATGQILVLVTLQ